MDYEKKYKEALERFKTFREKYCTYGDLHFGDVIFDKTGEAQKDLDAIFPELKESGDERMIKAIEHILYENYSDAAVIEGVEIAEIVTWLEKQKEQREATPETCLKGIFDFDDISQLELAVDCYKEKKGRAYPVTVKHQHEVLMKLYDLIGIDREALDQDKEVE